MELFPTKLLSTIPPWAILGIGVVTGGLRTVGAFIYTHTIGYAITKVSVSLTVDDRQHYEAYQWLSYWAEGHLSKRKVSSLLLRHATSFDPSAHDPGDRESSKYSLIPGYGSYYLMWLRRLMVIEHWETDSGSLSTTKTHRIRLQIWFTRNRQVLMDIMEDAKTEFLSNQQEGLDFHQYVGGSWVRTPVPKRAESTTYFEDGVIASLEMFITTFLSSRSKYEALGFPYRTGFSLEGPPGTGKTTLVTLMASKLNLPLYTLRLHDKTFTTYQLNAALKSCAPGSILLLEDIDTLPIARQRVSNTFDDIEGITLSDLLNALDGLGASEDRILIMTSNHPENLDAALTRSGRVNRRVYIGYSSDARLLDFYQNASKYFPQKPWEEFRAALPAEATISDAQALAFAGCL